MKFTVTFWLTAYLLLTASTGFAQYDGGLGTEVDPYQVSSIEQLDEIRNQRGEGGYTAFRAPALVVSNQGTILVFTEGRQETWKDDGAEDDLILKRSTDGGKTWGDFIVAVEDGENAVKTPVPIVLPSGRILLIYTWNEFMIDDSQRDTREVYIIHSDDDGLSWSEPRNITSMVYGEDWGWYGTGPGHGIVKEKEPHKGRVIVPARHNIRGERQMTSHFIYSDDDGETWEIGALALRHPKSSNESIAAELSNGDVMLNSRNGTDGEIHRVVSISSDGGETIDTMYLDQTLIEPTAQGSILNHSLNEQTGKYNILFSNPHSTELGVRVCGTLKLSHDDGQTWSKMYRYSDPSPAFSGYSDIAVINENGDIGVLFESGHHYMKELRYFGIAFRVIKFDDIDTPIDDMQHCEEVRPDDPEEQFYVFDARGKHYVQTADIDASDTENWNNNLGFNPIGHDNLVFKGSYDGNGYTIENLTINRIIDSQVGLFGNAGAGTIKNVSLVNVNISGGNSTGALVGQQLLGEIRNSSVSGNVLGDHRTGGLVGDNQGGKIVGSYAISDVEGSRRVGGLVGDNRAGGIIAESYATGNVSITFGDGHDAGGLVGASREDTQINYSYATGSVEAIGKRAGGLVGQNHESGTITNSFATGSVTNGDIFAGGLVGRNRQEANIVSSYSTGTVSGSDEGTTGGFTGENIDGEILDSYWDHETSGHTEGVGDGTQDGVTGLSTSQMSGANAEENMVGFNFSDTWKATEGYPVLYWVEGQATSNEEINRDIPSQINLGQNYPNPFNPTTKIQFELPQSEYVRLEVFDVTGQKVATLIESNISAGHHTINFNASRLASGIYFYRMKAGEFKQVKKLMLVK